MMWPWPDERGHFGQFGGRYVPETLMPALLELEATYAGLKNDPAFQQELAAYLRDYAGRPSLLYFARRLTQHCGGAKIYLKREDMNHTGAHKINNTLGQALVARIMGKNRVIAETGAGQHGVAVATVAALFGMRGLHGRRRHAAPVAQCLSHAATWKQGDPCLFRQSNSQRRHE